MDRLINNKLNVCVLSKKGSSSEMYCKLKEYQKGIYSLSELMIRYSNKLDGNFGITTTTPKDNFTKLLYEYFLEFHVSCLDFNKLDENTLSSYDIDIMLVDIADLNVDNRSNFEKVFRSDAYDDMFIILYGKNIEKNIFSTSKVLGSNMEYIYGMIDTSTTDKMFTDMFFYVKSIINILKLNRICYGLRKISNTDELTGLYNMRAYWKLYSQTLIKYKKEESSFGIMMIDVDNFKTINDTYYHMVGSRTLYEIGRILKDYIKEDHSCYISRYGGDEYISVVETNSKESFYSFVSELKHKLSNHQYLKGLYDIRLTVSIGAVYVDNFSAFCGEEPIKLADLLLYKSKILGKDRISSYSIKDQKEAERLIKDVADEIIKKSNNTVNLRSMRAVAFDIGDKDESSKKSNINESRKKSTNIGKKINQKNKSNKKELRVRKGKNIFKKVV